MIKEIASITRKCRYDYVAMQQSSNLLTTKIAYVEPDNFVDDDFKAETLLLTSLQELCKETGNVETLAIRRTAIPEGVSKVEHYNNILEEAEQMSMMSIYKNTMRFRPNYVICSSDWFPILALSKHFKMSKDVAVAHGTYCCGIYKDNIPVFIAPSLSDREMIWGVNDENSPGIVTFINEEDKICNKIANDSHFVLLKLED